VEILENVILIRPGSGRNSGVRRANAQRVTAEPRQLIATVLELTLVDVAEPEICCGSAGVYNLVQPEPAERLGQRKADNFLAAQPDVIATGNAGCLLQIRRHAGDAGPPVVHPIELLDAARRGDTSILPTATSDSPA
jgi:glycolate oxidase iron-sulfur subunit